MFCHIIETSDASDLEHMRGLVEALEATSNSQARRTCAKQSRLFKALYDVAAKYVEVKSRADGGQGWMLQYTDPFTGTSSARTLDSGGMGRDPGTASTVDAPVHLPSHGGGSSVGIEPGDGLVGPPALQSMAFGDVDMEMDLSGAELWDWFNKNQAIMSMLEDT